jgi:hypothetical protein
MAIQRIAHIRAHLNVTQGNDHNDFEETQNTGRLGLACGDGGYQLA